MAVIKAKRSVHPAQLRGRSKITNSPTHQHRGPRHARFSRGGVEVTKSARRNRRRATNRQTISPGQFVLNERNLPHRRFVEFPLARGKTIEKVELFTTRGHHSIALDFQDHTSLNLEIEPTFIINAEFQQQKKGDIEVLAEWPPIQAQK